MKSFADKTFSFTKNFKVFGIISIILVITGLAGLVLLPFGVNLFNFDIDFLGGATMQFDIHTELTTQVERDVRDIVQEVAGFEPSSVTSAGTGTEIVVKTKEMDTELREAVFDKLAEKYGLVDTDFVASDYVSASVGNDLKKSAIMASTIAAVLILLYITIRFEFRSGCAAVIALIHDLLVMVSMYIIFRIPFNMNFIAAALTIIGYSINATIVVFDRVRENAKAAPKESFNSVVDRSIWQTFTRSINTTITTLLPVIMIIILGVPSVRNFAVTLLIGMIAGAYSSVCISGGVWAKLKGIGSGKDKAKAKA